MAKSTEKPVFERTKPHCNIGTIGHVDHGKTTLTSAITKVLAEIGLSTYRDYNQIDSHKEERERGITISAAHVEYETKKRHYTHIDCPGHQDYIKNMIIGASQMEGVILVVSVTDGVQVQTREHVILAKEIGIPYMVVFMNKVDAMKEKSMLDLIELEIRELIESYGFDEETPFIKGSALKALQGDESYISKVKELMETVDQYVQLPERAINDPFLMPVESVLVAPGRGTVVTGKVEKGVLLEGDNLELVGEKNFQTVCMAIEMHRRTMTSAVVGDNIGVLLKGVTRKEIKRGKGYVLASPGVMKPYSKFKARVYVLSTEEGGRKTPFRSNYKPQFFFRVSNVTGTITLEEDLHMAMPGDTVIMTVELMQKAILNEGLRFILREGKLTVGAGFITELIS